MQYKYAKEQQDYSDFASGRVFYSLPGHPAFPVRLASEIFQRCLATRAATYNISTPCTLYDPCCGAAYHLSVLAYLHGGHLQKIIASDIDEKAVALATRNLGLLTLEGLEKRVREISTLLEEYGKDSHQEALSSANALRGKLVASPQRYRFETTTFQANAADRQKISTQINPGSVDLVFTDVPYGWHSHWRGEDADESPHPLEAMLEALLDVLSPASIVAIVSDKRQKVSHPRYQRLEQFQIGKRRAVILKPI